MCKQKTTLTPISRVAFCRQKNMFSNLKKKKKSPREVGPTCPKSIQRILLQQEGDQLLGLGLHRPVVIVRPLDVVVDRVGKQLLRRLAKEGDAADEKLVEDDAHAPPVHRLAVALPEYDLRGNILRRAEHLLVRELLCLLVDVALVEVGRQRHETHF